MITSGLKAGDKVVIDGVDRLRDGAKVKVADPAAAGAGRPGGRSGIGGEGSAAGSTKGAGQHHKHRHDQSGAAEDRRRPPRPPIRRLRPTRPLKGQRQGAASSTAPAPASPTTAGGASAGRRGADCRRAGWGLRAMRLMRL